jgi:Skp family chaperone for outer membrane proteins
MHFTFRPLSNNVARMILARRGCLAKMTTNCRRRSSGPSSASNMPPLEFLKAAQQASEARLQAAQKELKADLQAAQQGSEARLQAAQQASEARLHAAQKELKADLQAGQKELKADLQAGQKELKADLQAGQKELKKDLQEIIKLSGYKLIVSMTTILAGLLSLFGTVGIDITAPWSKPTVSNKQT